MVWFRKKEKKPWRERNKFGQQAISVMTASVLFMSPIGSAVGALTTPTTVYAADEDSGGGGGSESATERIINQIKLSAIKDYGSKTNFTMSDSEFKTVGFALSNALVPFDTVVDGHGSNVEELLRNVVTKGLLFEGDTKTIIDRTVSELTQPKTLFLVYSTDGGTTWESDGLKASYSDMLFGSLRVGYEAGWLGGNFSDAKKTHYSYQKRMGTKTRKLTNDYRVGFSYKQAPEKRSEISYEFSLKGDTTVSQEVFLGLLQAASDTSFGKSIIMTKNKDMIAAVDEKVYGDALMGKNADGKGGLKMKLHDIYKTSIYNAPLFVDTFGNISTQGTFITKGKNSKVVIMPGPANPMMFAKKKGEFPNLDGTGVNQIDGDEVKDEAVIKAEETLEQIRDGQISAADNMLAALDAQNTIDQHNKEQEKKKAKKAEKKTDSSVDKEAAKEEYNKKWNELTQKYKKYATYQGVITSPQRQAELKEKRETLNAKYESIIGKENLKSVTNFANGIGQKRFNNVYVETKDGVYVGHTDDNGELYLLDNLNIPADGVYLFDSETNHLLFKLYPDETYDVIEEDLLYDKSIAVAGTSEEKEEDTEDKEKDKEENSSSTVSTTNMNKDEIISKIKEAVETSVNDPESGVGKGLPATSIPISYMMNTSGAISFDGGRLQAQDKNTSLAFATGKTGGADDAFGGDNSAKLNNALISMYAIHRLPSLTKDDADVKSVFEDKKYGHNLKVKGELKKGDIYTGNDIEIRLATDKNWISDFAPIFAANGGSSDELKIYAKSTSATIPDSNVYDSIIVGDWEDKAGYWEAFNEKKLDEWSSSISIPSQLLGKNDIVSNESFDKLEADSHLKNVYLTYLIARGAPHNPNINFVINMDGTPEVDSSFDNTNGDENGGLGNDNDAVLKNMAYFMLNPTLGREYKQRWSKTFINQVLLQSVMDMTGSNTSSNYGGTTRYLELAGFGALPKLEEVKLTSFIYQNFTLWGVVALVVAGAISLIFIFTKQAKVLPTLVAIAALGFMLYLPVSVMNGSISVTNAVSNSFYKDKFYFWVLYQHQSYEDSLNKLLEAAEDGDQSGYNKLLLQLQGGTGEQDDVFEWQRTLGAAVKVRWMAPKKDGYITQANRKVEKFLDDNLGLNIEEGQEETSNEDAEERVANGDEEEKDSGDSEESSTSERSDNNIALEDGQTWGNNGLTKSLITAGLDTQNYTGLDTNYLYRGYTDIADYSRFYYGNLMEDAMVDVGSNKHYTENFKDVLNKMFEPNDTVVSVTDKYKLTETGDYLKRYMGDTTLSGKININGVKERENLGFINNRKAEGEEAQDDSEFKNTHKRLVAPVGSTTVSEASTINLNGIKIGDSYGLTEDDFILTIKDFVQHNESLHERMTAANDGYGESKVKNSEDAAGLSTFALFTESPFYYFSFNLYDQGLSTEKENSGEFKEMMLEENDSFFYNYQMTPGASGYGAMKDFMDFGSLFSVIIPYLREANKPLLQWSDKYGTKPFAGYGADRESLDAIEDTTSEAYYKTWHNYTANNAYRTYSAWVDALYDLEIARPETIEYAGKKFKVEEPLNPLSYVGSGREMVFSESERLYWGIEEYELTRVERAILKTQKDIRNDWLQIMNFYQLDDVVLNTVASMIVTFNFNKNFSQMGLTQEQIILEPQGFELKTFGFDGYLRLIMQQATGESIGYNKELRADIYEIVAEKDGWVTTLQMWFVSVISTYILPFLSIVIIMVTPIAAILSILSGFVRRDGTMFKTLAKSCVGPFGSVLLANIFLAWLTSGLMGDGNTSLVTGPASGISDVQSPRSVLGILLLAVTVVALIYGYAIFKIGQNGIRNYKVVSIPIQAGVEAAASAITGGAGKVMDAATGNSKGNTRVRDAVGGKGSGGSGGQSTDNLEERSRRNIGSSQSKSKRRFLSRKRKSSANMEHKRVNDKKRQKQLDKELEEAIQQNRKSKKKGIGLGVGATVLGGAVGAAAISKGLKKSGGHQEALADVTNGNKGLGESIGDAIGKK